VPTGYTEEVAKGNITTITEYAQLCAKAFFRFDSLPLSVPMDYSYLDKIKEIDDELKALNNMTQDQRAAASLDENLKKLKCWSETETDRAKATHNYNNMKLRIMAWYPPESCAALKKFMLDQIDVSVKAEEYKNPSPVLQSTNTWFKNKNDALTIRKGFYGIRHEENLKHHLWANTFLKELKEFLP
jgi:hypothetical protein